MFIIEERYESKGNGNAKR